MALKGIFPALLANALLLAGGSSLAAPYQPGDFFNLDLSKAVLSPTPLGPPTEFAKVPVEARSGRTSDVSWARHALNTEPRKVAAETVKASLAGAVAQVHGPAKTDSHARIARRHDSRRVRLAHRHRRGNPMDAEAMDTSIQVWPCRSGGICNWKQ